MQDVCAYRFVMIGKTHWGDSSARQVDLHEQSVSRIWREHVHERFQAVWIKLMFHHQAVL
jgi:hypothetical protein